LKEWDIAINYGVKTGFNAAFIIDNQTKEALIVEDRRSEELIKPVVRGRDIRRYQAQWAGLWLIDTHNGFGNVPAIEIDDYPAVKTHLDHFYDRLAKRYDKGSTPYNLRNCAYHEQFSNEKLLWMDLTNRGRFALVGEPMFAMDTTFMMSGSSLKYLCAFLNNKLASWFMSTQALTSGMGTARWKQFTVERIPIPHIPTQEQMPISALVDRILAAKSMDTDTSTLELEVDSYVYELYGLTAEEVLLVEERS